MKPECWYSRLQFYPAFAVAVIFRLAWKHKIMLEYLQTQAIFVNILKKTAFLVYQVVSRIDKYSQTNEELKRDACFQMIWTATLGNSDC